MTEVSEKAAQSRDEAQAFYIEAMRALNESGFKYMVGGGVALYHHTGIARDMKDLDLFCKSSEFPKILKFFADRGDKTQVTDIRWLAKIFRDEHYIDLIFDTVNNICRVDDSWFENAEEGEFLGVPVKVMPVEELIFCKIYVQNRERYDGADVNHALLKKGKDLDWKRLLYRMDQHWHLLLCQILNFQFVYPSDYRDIVPKWLFDELMERAQLQYALPAPVEHVCRGPIIDQTQYSVDIKLWDYKAVTIKTV